MRPLPLALFAGTIVVAVLIAVWAARLPAERLQQEEGGRAAEVTHNPPASGLVVQPPSVSAGPAILLRDQSRQAADKAGESGAARPVSLRTPRFLVLPLREEGTAGAVPVAEDSAGLCPARNASGDSPGHAGSDGVYMVEISAEGETVPAWSQGVDQADVDDSGSIGLMLPGGVLAPGRYRITVCHPDGREAFQSRLEVRG